MWRENPIHRRAIAFRRLRYASALPSVTPRTLQPRNVLQGVSIGNVHLQVRFADHDMNHISGDFLFAIAEYANNLVEQRVIAMRTSAGGAWVRHDIRGRWSAYEHEASQKKKLSLLHAMHTSVGGAWVPILVAIIFIPGHSHKQEQIQKQVANTKDFILPRGVASYG